MRRFYIWASALLCAGVCLADPPGLQPLTISNLSILSTNQSVYTAPAPVTGYFEGIEVYATALTAGQVTNLTFTVTTKAGNGLSTVARTLASLSSVTANGEYIIRAPTVAYTGATTNQPARFPLVGDVLVLTAYNGTGTNLTLKVLAIVSPQ